LLSDVSQAPVALAAGINYENLQCQKLLYRSPEGTTEVFEGTVDSVPGKVAVKVMYCLSEAEIKRKQEEATLQSSLSHPNICRCLESFVDNSYRGAFKFVIIMEYSERGDLEQEIDLRKLRSAYWPEAELMRHFTQLIDAFAALQEHKIIHGDIKPRNLFISGDLLKVGDFGESKQGLQALVTRTYQVTGTVVYFSPLLYQAYIDIIKAKRLTADVRHNPVKSDVYSLGLTFLHMLTLQKPGGLNDLEQGADHLQRQVDQTLGRLTYSEAVKKLLSHMLQVNEPSRCDFKQLKEFLSGGTIETRALKADEQPEVIARKAEAVAARPAMKLKGPLIVATSQAPSKAFLYEVGSGHLSSVISQRFQASARILILGSEALITGGLKSPCGACSLDLHTREVKRLPDLGTGRSWHSCFYYNSAVYVVAGRSADKRGHLTSVERLTTTWEAVADINEERENCTACVCDTLVYLAGGSSTVRGCLEFKSSIERYDGVTWSLLEVQLPVPACGVSLFALSEDQLLCSGGSLPRGAFSTASHQISIQSQEVTAVQDLPEGDATYGQTVVHGDTAYFMGSQLGVYAYSISQKAWELLRY
jgi:serine/threonine protein kinase